MSRLESALGDLRLADTLASRDNPLSRLDPRAKIVTTIAFLVAVVSCDRYTVVALLPFLLYPVALVSMGEVPWRWLLRKLALAARSRSWWASRTPCSTARRWRWPTA